MAQGATCHAGQCPAESFLSSHFQRAFVLEMSSYSVTWSLHKQLGIVDSLNIDHGSMVIMSFPKGRRDTALKAVESESSLP